MNYFGLSDIGQRRSSNQDCFRIFNAKGFTCALVCDGMGGANGGNIASALTSAVFEAEFTELISICENHREALSKIDKIIERAIYKANYEVYRKSLHDISLTGMGTTFTSFITDGKEYITVNVGDSRTYFIPDIHECYDIRDVFMKKLTKDHSLVQSLIDSGTITEDEAAEHPKKNIIMRAIGVEESVEADIVHHELSKGLILLCSDGLSGYFDKDRSYLQILRDENTTLEEKAETLIEYANFNGGSDNITAVLVEI